MTVPFGRAVLAVLLLVPVAGCAAASDPVDADGSTSSTGEISATTAGTNPAGPQLLLLDNEDYLLRNADRFSESNPYPLAAFEPSVQWMAEYSSGPPLYSEWIRVSGHDASVAALRREGLLLHKFETRAAGSWDVLAADTPPDDPAGPSVVLIELGDDFVVMVLSYELGVGALVDWVADLRVVSDEEWTTTVEASNVDGAGE